MKKIILIMMILFLVSFISATTYYISEDSAGTGDGTSYNNRASVATHNSGIGVFADLSGDIVVLTGNIISTLEIENSINNDWSIYDGNDGINPPAYFVGTQTYAIYTSSTKNIELKNINFSDFDYVYAIMIDGSGFDGFKIHDFYVHNSNVRFAATNFIRVLGHGADLEIYNNHLDTHNYFNGIVITQSTLSGDMVNISIHDNTFIDARHSLIEFDNWPGGVPTSQIRNIKFYNNDMSGPNSAYTHGISIGGYSTSQYGIEDVYVYNNYLHDLRTSNQIKGANNVHWHNNLITLHRDTCVNINLSIAGTDSDCKAAYADWVTKSYFGTAGLRLYPTPATLGSVYINNNVFYNNSRMAIDILSGSTNTIDISNNIFFENDLVPNVNWEGTTRADIAPITAQSFNSNLVAHNNVIYNTVSNTQAFKNVSIFLTVTELNDQAYASDNLMQNPFFVDANNADFYPQSTSSAIDAGIDVGLTQDYDGTPVPQGVAPDIGAYEYTGDITPTCQSENYQCCDFCESNPQPLYDADCPQVCCEVCTASTNQVLHFTFEEGLGTTATDSSGNNNHGTINGATYTTGKIGNYALEFDGVDDYVDCGNDDSLDVNYLTASLWLKADSFSDNAGLFAKGDNLNRQYWAWIYQNNLSLEINEGGFHNNLYPFQTDTWYHLTVKYDGSNIVIYINGIEVGNFIQNTGQILTDDNSLIIGNLPGLNYFDGVIDEVRIYNYALTSGEVLALYNEGGSSCGSADSDFSGSVSITELINYITRWKAGNVNINDLINGITEWKNGC